MPKVGRFRVKLHDLAPGSVTGDAATSACGRFPTFTSATGNGDSLRTEVKTRNTISRPSNASSTLGHQGSTQEPEKRTVKEAGVPIFAATGQLGPGDDSTVAAKYLSRGQRRRAEKRDAWLRKFDFTNYALKLREENQRQQNNHAHEGPLATFAPALRRELPDVDVGCSKDGGTRAVDNAVQNNRKRITRRAIQRLAEREIAQYNAVVAFPAFRSRPLAVLKQHLQNTVRLQQRAKEYV